MSSIEKLLVQGIRSFNPEEPTVIKFFTPLTLICGHNGAGKTTVIEGLRYATTGEFPPNSNSGKSFIHDPKIAGDSNVKGQVKLRFKNTAGKTITCTRSLQLTQTMNSSKQTLKTLENNLEVKDLETGKKNSLTRKCADIDREIPIHLGVSKAVLDYVVFCHQEDSNWPLGDPAKLKDKFDGIFASTRYTKALENIRKYRNELSSNLKMVNLDLNHYKVHRERAVELQQEIESNTEKLGSCKERIRDIRGELQPLIDMVSDLEAKLEEIRELKSKRMNLKEMRQVIEKQVEEVSENLEELPDTDEEMQEKLENFEKDQQHLNKEISRKMRKLEMEQENQNTLNIQLQNTQATKTKLEFEEKNFENALTKAKEAVFELSREYELEKYVDDSISESDIQNFTSMLQNVISRRRKAVADKKKEAWRVESNYDSEINELRDEVSKSEQKQSSNKTMIKNRRQELLDVENDMGGYSNAPTELEYLDKKLTSIKKEVDSTTKEVHVENLKDKRHNYEKNKREIQEKIDRLNNDVKSMNLQAATRAKIQQMKETMEQKNVQKEKIFSEYHNTFTSLFDEEDDPIEMERMLNKMITSKKALLRELQEKQQTALVTVKSSEAFKPKEEARMKSMCKTLQAMEDELKAELGSKSYEDALEETNERLAIAQMKVKEIESASQLVELYKKEAENKRRCAVCCRDLETDDAIADFMAKLEERRNGVPEKTKKCKRKLENAQKKKDKIEEIRPTYLEFKLLKSEKIPKAKESLNKLQHDITMSKSQLQEITNKLEEAKQEVEKLEDVQNAVENLNTLIDDLDSIKVDICKENTNLFSRGNNTTVEEVCKEIENYQTELKEISQNIDRLSEQIRDHELLVARLSNQLRQAQHEKEMCLKNVESLRQLKSRFESLNESIAKLETDNKVLSRAHEPLRVAFENKKSEKATKKNELEQVISTLSEKVSQADSDLNRYALTLEKLNNSKQIISARSRQSIDKELEELKKQMENAGSLIKQIYEDIQNTKSQLNSQSSYQRSLQDNLKLRKLRMDLKKNKNSLTKIDNAIGQYIDEDLDNDKTQVTMRIRELNEERANQEGRETELKVQTQRTKRELDTDIYRNAQDEYKKKLFSAKTTQMANNDLDRFYKALDATIVQYHRVKMEEINKIIKEMWANTYCGTDIDTIEIRSDAAFGTTGKRSYQYRVVMMRGDVEVDMKGKCSAGQKVLASLIIRLALAETFCINCGILALDEPTANLDSDNIEKFAQSLSDLIQNRRSQRNFQLIVITHDENFVKYLGRSESNNVESYYRITRDDKQHTKLDRKSFRNDTLDAR